MRQMHASVVIDLPEDEFAEAAAKLQVRPVWEAFLAGLNEAEIAHVAKLETLETRAKAAKKEKVPGAPRAPRTPRQPSNGGAVLPMPPAPGGEAA